MPFENILFRTTDALKWGTGKGSPLSAVEVDENFYEVITRIVDLEENPPMPVNIETIQVIGSQLTIFLSDGSSYGPFTLPVAQFRFRDEWLPIVEYLELDLVSVAGQGLFMVRLDHTSAATFDPDATDGDGHALYLKVFGEDTYIYTTGFFYPGKPGTGLGAEELMLAHLFNESVYILTAVSGCYAKLITAPTADLEFEITKNGTSIGTITFTAPTTDGVIALTDDVQFDAEDILGVNSAAAIDTTAENLVVTLRGFRGTLTP